MDGGRRSLAEAGGCRAARCARGPGPCGKAAPVGLAAAPGGRWPGRLYSRGWWGGRRQTRCCAVLLGLPLFTAVLLLQLISCLFTLSASGVAAVLSVSQYAVAETGYFRGTFSFVWLYASK